MKYIVEMPKSVEQAAGDLQAAVQRHKFGVLHTHNLRETLKKKGVDFPNACQILEICNPLKSEEGRGPMLSIKKIRLLMCRNESGVQITLRPLKHQDPIDAAT